jgi:GAF domain-containing protein
LRSSLSIALPIQESTVGALNIYATQRHAFDDDSIELARTFASYAAVAVANAHLYETNATLAENMRTAMDTRAVIEQAKGIIMGREGCDPQLAFAILSKQSQHSNRKLRDVATDIVNQAIQPAGPPPSVT